MSQENHIYTIPEPEEFVQIDGYCPICEAPARFIAKGRWYRGTLICQTCKNGSTPRERALSMVLNRSIPDWRKGRIHECSPMGRGISVKLKSECEDYTGTHYFPGEPLGEFRHGWRNENIEATTFPNESFDIVVSMDVMEHVFRPDLMIKDVYRTIKPGGFYISTFPVRKWQVEPAKQLARQDVDGRIEYLKQPPEYHGNPIDKKGSLVTWDYGYDIHTLISNWAPFSIEVSRFHNPSQGIIGEYTEVFLCQKVT